MLWSDNPTSAQRPRDQRPMLREKNGARNLHHELAPRAYAGILIVQRYNWRVGPPFVGVDGRCERASQHRDGVTPPPPPNQSAQLGS